jgi:hypothetical protein
VGVWPDCENAGPGPGGDASAAWPVGSVFTSVVSTNPATLLGFGTWSSFAAGRVLIGIDSGDTAFDVAEETGGALSQTPSGTVSQPTFTGSALGTHSHSPGTLATSAHSGTAVADHPAHTHGYTEVLNHTHPVNDSGHTHIQNSHNHTQDAHTHVQNSHTHTEQCQGGTTASTTGTHIMTSAATGGSLRSAGSSTVAATAVNQNATATNQVATAVNQSATTGVTTANPAGGVASGTTGGPSATLTHSVTQPADHTLSGATQAVSAGTPAGTVSQPNFSGASMSVVQPYIVVYFWKRTA